MKNLSLMLSGTLAALALNGAIAGATSSATGMHAAAAVSVAIAPQNGSGQRGTATLRQEGANVVVSVVMTGVPSGSAEPAHIHPGTCAKLNPAPKYPLTSVTEGTTTTTLQNVQLASLLGGKFAINVHNAKNLSTYVACGDIK